MGNLNIRAQTNSPVKENHTIRNTAIAAAIGASINAGVSAISQKNMMSDKDQFASLAKDVEKLEKGEIKSIPWNFIEITKDSVFYKQILEDIKVATTGKFSMKTLAEAGICGAAIVGGITLLVNLIKNRKSEEK